MGYTCPTFDFEEEQINCLDTSQWCNEASSYTCGEGNKTWGGDLKGIKVTDPRICGNFEFWENQECAVGLKQMQHRCTGNYPGQCVYNDFDEKEQVCKDKSDTNVPAPAIGKKCPKTGQLRCLSRMKFWDIRIKDKNSKITDEYMYEYPTGENGNPTEYVYMYPDGSDSGPVEHGSGSGSGPEERSSGSGPEDLGSGNKITDEYEYTYMYPTDGDEPADNDEPAPPPFLKHKFICIEEASMCDGTPQCEYGEDEDEAMCAERKQQHRDATENFACPSPAYIIPKGIKIGESDEERFLYVSTTAKIRAGVKLSNESTFWRLTSMWGIRCDGERQCINGEDELDCLIIKETLKYALREYFTCCLVRTNTNLFSFQL